MEPASYHRIPKPVLRPHRQYTVLVAPITAYGLPKDSTYGRAQHDDCAAWSEPWLRGRPR